MKVWLRQKRNSVGEIPQNGLNLRLSQKMTLSQNKIVELD